MPFSVAKARAFEMMSSKFIVPELTGRRALRSTLPLDAGAGSAELPGKLATPGGGGWYDAGGAPAGGAGYAPVAAGGV